MPSLAEMARIACEGAAFTLFAAAVVMVLGG
jgi:hypothetical protein